MVYNKIDINYDILRANGRGLNFLYTSIRFGSTGRKSMLHRAKIK